MFALVLQTYDTFTVLDTLPKSRVSDIVLDILSHHIFTHLPKSRMYDPLRST